MIFLQKLNSLPFQQQQAGIADGKRANSVSFFFFVFLFEAL